MVEAPHAGEPERDVVVRVEEHAGPTEEVRPLRGEPQELRQPLVAGEVLAAESGGTLDLGVGTLVAVQQRGSERPAGAIGQEQGG